MLRLASRLRAAVFCAVLGLGMLGGCATTGGGDPRDPLEPVNRAIYTFNDGLDTMLVKPAAEVYQGVVPAPVRTGVSNVFANINDVIVALNNLLQGKFGAALSDIGRVLLNTTAGLLGIFDVATPAGLEKHDEDFGQTFGYWGIGDGPYLVLPFLGPRTTRDAVGTVVYLAVDPVSNINPPRDRNQIAALRLVSDRANLLSASRILAVAALDEYEFVRDAYLQRRRNLIYDGNPPREKLDGSSLPGDLLPATGAAITWSSGVPTPAEEEAARRGAAVSLPGPAGVTAMSAKAAPGALH